MKCPYSEKECTQVDTSGMDKIPCEECYIYVEKIRTAEFINDWNEFLMGL